MKQLSVNKKYTSLLVSCTLHALLLLFLLERQLHEPLSQDWELVPLQHNPAHVTLLAPAQADKQQLPASQPTKKESYSTTLPRTSPEQPLTGASKQEVTPEQFMRVFQAIVKADQYGSYANEGDESSAIPLHVAKRLKKWGKLHYKQRLAEAFLKAGKLLSRSIVSPKEVNKTLLLSVPIAKNGTLGDIATMELTGLQEVDQYLKDVLKSADFPPIPERFGTETFHLTLPLNISLKKGSRLYSISMS